MTFVGVLDADLQAATEYKSGGLGPFFRESRTEEPLSVLEFLSRTVKALRQAKVTSVVTLFLDEQEVYEDAEATDDNLADALAAAEKALDADVATSFSLMLTHEDDDLWHVITIEASVDHPADEAALTVLDTAKPVEDDAAPEEAVADKDDDSEEAGRDEPFEDDGEPDILDPDEAGGEALVEAFLRGLLQALHKELALDEPEIETWTDWEGEFDPESYYASALPGVGV